MSHTPTDTDPAAWHRDFAIECNNRAWKLTTQSRSEAQDREMLNAAHASAWHWAIAGKELLQMRATILLAEVHALLGYGAVAITYARHTYATHLCATTARCGTGPRHAGLGDRAAAHDRRARIVRDREAHRSSYRDAVAAIDAIANDEGRQIVLETFRLWSPCRTLDLLPACPGSHPTGKMPVVRRTLREHRSHQQQHEDAEQQQQAARLSDDHGGSLWFVSIRPM